MPPVRIAIENIQILQQIYFVICMKIWAIWKQKKVLIDLSWFWSPKLNCYPVFQNKNVKRRRLYSYFRLDFGYDYEYKSEFKSY